MRKIIIFLKFILRSKFIFKTPEKCDLVVFDEKSIIDLNICVSKFNFFILQTRLEKPIDVTPLSKFQQVPKIYFSYKILKKILKNCFKGNLFTIYLVSLIELINPKVVITTIDRSFKFSDVAKILDEKINFFAIQNSMTHDLSNWKYLYETKKIKKNLIKKLYIPNLFCIGDYDKVTWKKFGVNVKNFFPIGNLRLANFFYHIKAEKNSPEKYKSDICLVAEHSIHSNIIQSKLNESKRNEGLVKLIRYTIKFCLKHKKKLIIPLRNDKKYHPNSPKLEIEHFERNFKGEELNYIKKCFLERDRDDFSSQRALLNSEVTVSAMSTMLRHKLATGGKILSCNLTKIDRYNFPVNGICTLNNCSYDEFEKRLLEIYSISKKDYFSRIEDDPDYFEKYTKNYSTINFIREKLSQLGVRQNS